MSARAGIRLTPHPSACSGRARGAVPALGKTASREASRTCGMEREQPPAAGTASQKRVPAVSARAGYPVQTP